jgi:hypothetical protein
MRPPNNQEDVIDKNLSTPPSVKQSSSNFEIRKERKNATSANLDMQPVEVEGPAALSVIPIEGGGSVKISDNQQDAPALTMESLNKIGKNN